MAGAREEVEIAIVDPIETLRRCGGYYECLKGSHGQRLGPLVAYAGTYVSFGGEEKNYVGDVYYNFAKAEQYPHVIDHYAERMIGHLVTIGIEDVFVGAPMGGILFAASLARAVDSRVIFAEKKIVRPASKSSREESALVLGRHELKKGDKTVIVEDVCNNFSTTLKLIDLIERSGGSVLAVVCVININRSPYQSYQAREDLVLPVFSLRHLPTPQYKQEDPEVAEEISSGNIVWKPKDEWNRLEAAMQDQS